MITIVDYDAGNLHSVENALKRLGIASRISSDPEEVAGAEKLILPGVGAFGDAMDQLKRRGLDRALKHAAAAGTPLLGICLGLQVLFEESEESPGAQGLGILKGRIVHIPPEDGLKIPHIGWNSLHLQNDGRLFRNIPENTYVYFVHSYYLKADDERIVKATTEYGACIHASVEEGNVFATQFHPEKSSRVGMQILQNFCDL